MKYAYVADERMQAQPKLRGVCRACEVEVISKCGKHVVWHWAHRSRAQCDPWWENETLWHRDWKNRFPEEWQEVVHQDVNSRERHVADVKTSHGVVVEFQRSTIDSMEVSAREQFYGRMVWVIDGTRSPLDPSFFNMSLGSLTPEGYAYFRWMGRSRLFHRWHTRTPVFVDFGGESFWRVGSFDPSTKEGMVRLVNRELFCQALINGETDFSRGGGPAGMPQESRW